MKEKVAHLNLAFISMKMSKNANNSLSKEMEETVTDLYPLKNVKGFAQVIIQLIRSSMC